MTVEEIFAQFLDIEGCEIRPLGEGFINDTFIAEVNGEPEYILQRKNHIVFPNVPAMMDNIFKVTTHIKAKVSDPSRETLTIVPAKDGKFYYETPDGNFFAVCTFIKGSVCHDRADSPEMARQGGLGLGRFHKLVSDFKAPLVEVLKGFHNIRFRFQQWDASVARDAAGRVSGLAEEIGWIESRRAKIMAFWEKYENGEIPMRVIHGDTKISNFLFDAEDGHLLCAIDLDTMMSSTLLCDTGDALRAYTNVAAEDDAEKAEMSMDMFKAYMEGYLSQMGDNLTESEKKYLAFSGIYLTYEQTLRFLMDYIDGDTYYKTVSADHNLVRTHAQYRLLCSMERNLPEMEAYIASL